MLPPLRTHSDHSALSTQYSALTLLALLLLLAVTLTPVCAVPVDLDQEITNSIGTKLILIPSGKFLMGSPKNEKDRNDNEQQHAVEITKPFYLGVHTVTIGQFRQFVDDAGYQTEAEKDGQGAWGYDPDKKAYETGKQYNWQHAGWKQTDDHPVVNVTWNDAVAFCDWLSKKEGKTYRLPTEAEWEYSCRAGTKTRFWCGDEEETLKPVANMADASLKEKWPAASGAVGAVVPWDDGYPFTAPVGKFNANAFGLCDMHGNVWQWCADWYDGDYYKDSPAQDPQGPDSGEFRVFRGGSFANVPRYCRSAYRDGFVPSRRNYDIGFRVVRVR